MLADLPGFDATKITVFGAIAAIADRVARTPVGVSESDPPSVAVVLLGRCCETVPGNGSSSFPFVDLAVTFLDKKGANTE